MLFPWPDPIVGRVADVVTILGVPVLTAGTWQIVREFRKERASRRKIESVSHGCLEFSDEQGGINLVPLETVAAFPGPGDIVLPPGETLGGENRGKGFYEVESMSFIFMEAPEIDEPSPAVPSKVIVHVRERVCQ